MAGLRLTFIVCLLHAATQALYDHNANVVDLTDSNFQSRVLDSDQVWIVEFYAPWCGHCKSLAPEYAKAADALVGTGVRIGAVDMTQHQSVGQPYGIQGFPTIKIFGGNKKKPSDYNGARSAQGIIDAGLSELKRVVQGRLGGGGGKQQSGGGGGSGPGSAEDVIELTDGNFESLVLNSDDLWLVEFFAPWCGHCKSLAPHWQKAATQLKGRVKLGALDATVHTVMSNRFGVRGFPTIKMFPSGKKTMSDAVDYDGGRTASDIVRWAEEKVAENVPAPEVTEITEASVLAMCQEKQLCVISFFPDLLDCQSKCRNGYIKTLTELGEKFKKNLWGWLWTSAGAQMELQDALGIGGFGYPAMAVVNARKGKFSILKGPFTYDGIHEFLRDLSYGRGSTQPLKGGDLPKGVSVKKWDGKDAEMPIEEDIDLSDVDLDEPEKIEL